MKMGTIPILVILMLTSLLMACGTDSKASSTGASPDLPGTEWTLTSLNGSSLIEDTEITLYFKEAYLGGTMTCNQYGGGPDSGKYTATDRGKLTIPQIAATVQLCTEPEGIMEQEAAYIQALHDAATYQVTGSDLKIANAGGRTTLAFEAKQ
jgi:heat shock protein HslJ